MQTMYASAKKENLATPKPAYSQPQTPEAPRGTVPVDMVRQPSENVNTKFSLKEEQVNAPGFKRWFGKSKVVNEDGGPRVVYHGANSNFNVFESQDGAFWFSENEDYAESMAEVRKGNRIIQAYLKMERPYTTKLAPGQFTDPIYERPLI